MKKCIFLLLLLLLLAFVISCGKSRTYIDYKDMVNDTTPFTQRKATEISGFSRIYLILR